MKIIKRFLIPFLCFALILTLLTPGEVQAFDKAKAKKNVTVTYKKTPTGVLAIYKNKNKTALTLNATFRFRDAAKKDLSKETQKNLCLGAKSTATFFFAAPRDEYGNCINYSSYSGSFSVSKSKKKTYVKNIQISSQIDTVETKFAAINTGKKDLTNIHTTMVFYYVDGSISRCFTKELNCYKAGELTQFSIQYPDDMGKPDKVKVYVDWAY